jgi:hypothetical protein
MAASRMRPSFARACLCRGLVIDLVMEGAERVIEGLRGNKEVQALSDAQHTDVRTEVQHSRERDTNNQAGSSAAAQSSCI